MQHYFKIEEERSERMVQLSQNHHKLEFRVEYEYKYQRVYDEKWKLNILI